MSNTSIACIAFNEKKVLIAHRNPVGQMGERWEFPGGKVEAGESDEAAVIREFREEFGVDVKVGSSVAETFFKHNDDIVALHAYEVFLPHDGIEKKFALTEHTEYKWAELSEIPTLNFVDSDMLIFPFVAKYLADSISD
ncbi:MAG: NUDIX domain-containing protein [Treponema sp.]|nr:NUDIX domain-containing protein [Treponema sp.]